MDTLLEEFSGSLTGFKLDSSVFSNKNFDEGFEMGSLDGEGEISDDGEFPNTMLKYINEILMNEDLEGKTCMLQDCLALQAAEKSFYDVLGQSYPPFVNEVKENPDGYFPIWDKRNLDLVGNSSRGKKNRLREDSNDSDEEERSNKQSACYSEEFGESEFLDEVLLCSPVCEESGSYFVFEKSKLGEKGKLQNNGKRKGKRNLVDLSTLLTQCAQAVSSHDQRTASELLKQIRQHSSPLGDGSQRLAYYLVDGLEARMGSNPAPIYTHLVNNHTPALDILKAYHLFVSVCPFKIMSSFLANRTIMILAEKAESLHIIDFGILYGFQWPCLIKVISERPGGPPKLRITGIELPQPGFRPAERIEQTGQRLENYCKRFNVQFEYHVIAQKWETIKYEDLKIGKDEITVVNCLFRLKNLPDETLVVDSPRDAVLNLIKQIKPDLFIHGVVNGTYSAPFFLTRFREALFHFSALFDMFEATIPRENQQRKLYEREVFARDAMNVIACEGWERVERPESYKQWQVRNVRAGFIQASFDKELLKKVKHQVKLKYHKDFVVDKDGQWVLLGWKGRIIHAITCWKPA